MMSTADIFSQYFLGLPYAEITDVNNRVSIDDLLRTGETGVMKAMQAKRAAVKAMHDAIKSGTAPDAPAPAVATAYTLTPAQELEAQELAETKYHLAWCSLCEARKETYRKYYLSLQEAI